MHMHMHAHVYMYTNHIAIFVIYAGIYLLVHPNITYIIPQMYVYIYIYIYITSYT